jgi:DNA-binding LytR/AlgR family response regulator
MQNMYEWYPYHKLSLKVGDGYEFVFFTEIVYVEACDKHVLVYLINRDKPIESQSCFSEILEKLPEKPLFYVCERSHIISMIYIDKFVKKTRELITSKGKITISKKHVKEFEDLFCK